MKPAVFPIAMIIVLLMALGMFLAAIPERDVTQFSTVQAALPISCNVYVIELDGHEYYFVQRGLSGIALAHKANCKACGKEEK